MVRVYFSPLLEVRPRLSLRSARDKVARVDAAQQPELCRQMNINSSAMCNQATVCSPVHQIDLKDEDDVSVLCLRLVSNRQRWICSRLASVVTGLLGHTQKPFHVDLCVQVIISSDCFDDLDVQNQQFSVN